MIFSILTRRFQVNKSARPSASNHRLYRQAMKNDRENTWGTYLLLEALYHKLPGAYIESVERKFSARVNSNETSRYMAFFPNTVQPTRVDRDTAGARAFRTLYPKLRNIPYWARMGLEEPVIENVASYRDISFDSDEMEISRHGVFPPFEDAEMQAEGDQLRQHIRLYRERAGQITCLLQEHLYLHPSI